MYKIPATTLFFGKNLIFMPECHSTNDEMLLLCQKASPPEGTLIITAQQTAGRGQRGNFWEAEPGRNLTFTILAKPVFLPIQKQFYLNIFISLGVQDYLTENSGPKVQIKWPNDILCNGKKICGILIENQIKSSVISTSAIGIGLNVNQQQFNTTTATSMINETGESADLQSVLDSLLHALEVRYLQLKSERYDLLLKDYLARLFQLGQLYSFSDKNGLFTGTITGIDDNGRLIILRDQGESTYDLKEIRYIGEAQAKV